MCDGDVQQTRAGAPWDPVLHLFVTSPFLTAVPAHAILQVTEEWWG